MADLHENYLDWLRDAHAMEEQAETMLKKMAGRLEHYPVLETRIKQHIDETREQQRLVESIIKRYDSSSSTFKDVTAKMAALGQAMGGMLASDEVVKGAISGYVFENLEIASYTSLIAAAKAVGDTEGERILTQILAQEKAMASWLLEHLPEGVLEILCHSSNILRKRNDTEFLTLPPDGVSSIRWLSSRGGENGKTCRGTSATRRISAR